MSEIQRGPNIVIFEGAQGSGKTSATQCFSENGYKKVRGIPTGPELLQNSEAQNWRQSCLILTKVAENGDFHALDRSLVSLIAFNMRKRPKEEDLIYNLGVSMFRRSVNGKSYCVVAINAKADECLTREDKASVVAIGSLEEAQREVETYSRLVEKLRTDGLNIISVDNTGVSKEEFLLSLTKKFNFRS